MRRYRALVTLPGARVPLVFATVGSMPIGMYGLALLLLVRDTTGSFAQAGAVAGAFNFANALGAVAQGRLMDRLGQTRVLRIAAAGHVPALAAVVAAARAGAPVAVLALVALAGGLTLPQLPAAMRSLWAALVSDPEQRATAYALVAVTFELAVVGAPAIVAVLVAVASPDVAVLAGAGLAGVGVTGFTATAASRRWRGEPHAVGWLGPLVAPGMRTVFAVLAVFGTALGVVQVAVPAFARAHGSDAAAGVLLAALSAGSLAGGLVYGARRWPGTPPARLAGLLLGLAAGFVALSLAGSRPAVAALLLGCGLLVAPTAVVGSTLLDTVAPPGTVTEAFAAMVMGIVVGNAVGNALGGSLVEASYEAAVLTAAALAAGGAGLAAARRRSLSAP